MTKDKEKQEISVVGRLLSLEALLLLMGIISLISGLVAKDALRLALGAIILVGLFMLNFLRKRLSK